MANDTADLLQIKIEKAKRELPLEAVNAIDSVNWRAAVLSFRETKGYTFEQLGDLELETELLLCGLLNPESYPRELEIRMGITKSQASELVAEMNEKVFARIKEQLIKSTERKQNFHPSTSAAPEAEKITESREDILKTIEKPEEKSAVHPILAQKLSGSLQTPIIKTEHTLENITKAPPAITPVKPSVPAADPYREIPE